MLEVSGRVQKETNTKNSKFKNNTKKQDIKDNTTNNITSNNVKNNNTVGMQDKTHKQNGYNTPDARKYIISQVIKIFGYLHGIIFIFIILYIFIKNIISISKCLRERKYYGKDVNTGLKIYTLENAQTPFLLGKIYI